MAETTPQPPSPPAKIAKKKKAKKAKKASRGRPRYTPTDEDKGAVKSLSAAGYPQEQIARYMRIDAKTLRKHFARELEFAVMEMLGAAIGGLADGLKKKEAWAICYVLKTRGKKLHNGEGWGEYDSKVPNPDGGGEAIPVHLSSLRDDQLLQLLARLKLAAQTADARANAPAGIVQHR